VSFLAHWFSCRNRNREATFEWIPGVISNLDQSSCEKENSVCGVPLIKDSSGLLSTPSQSQSPLSYFMMKICAHDLLGPLPYLPKSDQGDYFGMVSRRYR
jgi:hypothetical protein